MPDEELGLDVGPSSVTIDDIDSMQSGNAPTTETPNEIATRLKAMEDALRVSEQSRLQTQQMLDLAIKGTPKPPEPVAAAPVAEPEVSDEQLAEMYVADPVKAIRIAADQAAKRTERNLSSRMGGLFEGASSIVEQQAREKYKLEFELFEDDIKQVIQNVPNAKQALSTQQAWDDLVQYVRGKGTNVDKLIERKLADRRSGAQDRQARDAGASLTSSRGAAPAENHGLDKTQMEIADNLGMTYADYAKWSKVR